MMAVGDLLPVSRTSRPRTDGLGRFVPPAARRPATALTLLLLVITLGYIFLRPRDQFAPTWSSPGDRPPESPWQDGDFGDTSSMGARFDELPVVLRNPSLFPLSQKLVDFLARPALSHEAAKDEMRARCPLDLADNLVNPDQYKGNQQFWEEDVTPEVILSKRAELVDWLAIQVDKGEEVIWREDSNKATSKGQGIVMTAGNKDTVARTIFQLRHLKGLGSTLPVEVFHYPGELTGANQRAEIESLGATIKEVRGVSKTPGAWKNWQLKGLALIQSSFQEILALDSDNAPLRDPSHLFHASTYLDHGRAAFWPDLSKDHPDNAIWRLVGEACTLNDWTFETGQMVVDKAGNGGLNLAALWLVAAMLDDRDFWFKMCGGDKDTFRWAWRMLDLDFGRSPRWMSSVGIVDGDHYCGHTVLQYDLVTEPGEDRPRPLFAHSNLLKHLGAWGLHRGHLFTHTKRLRLDTYDLATLNYVRQYVKTGRRGMCLDAEWLPIADERLTDAEKRQFEIEVVSVSEIEGGMFDGFEDAFFDEGGKVGGW